MQIDLLAGIVSRPVAVLAGAAPTVLVLDSGLGGLTVYDELRRARPDARFVYAADDAAFPVGRLDEGTLRARVVAVMERLVARHAPDLVVVACNTISTIALSDLRERFAIPVIGVVPAIKPAAELTRSGLVTLLATPGTVRRAYTRDLVAAYAGACRVTLVGSPLFAPYAEAELRGEPVTEAALAAELKPCFREEDGRRTDVVVLGCTHYPLLRPRLEALAPWPVTWIDSGPAIARRMLQLVGPACRGVLDMGRIARAVFTSGRDLTPVLRAALAARGLVDVEVDDLPLALQ